MKTLYFMLFALTLLCGCNVKKDEHCGEDQNIKAIKLKQLLEQRQLDAALVLSDSLIVEYPESL